MNNNTHHTELVSLLSRGTPEARTNNLGAKVGDTVAVHSRGKNRWAKVVKAGPKNITCEYVTQGSIDEYVRILESQASYPVEAMARSWGLSAGENWDYDVKTLAAWDSGKPLYDFTTQAQIDASRAKVSEPREAHVARVHAEKLAEFTRTRANARAEIAEGNFSRFARVTTVTVSRAE